MIETLLKRLRLRETVSDAEASVLRGLFSEVRRHDAGARVVRRGQKLDESLLLLDGWFARARDDLKGNRQILELQLPGDFADLHSFTLKTLDHDIVALTQIRLAAAPHERIKALTETHPRLTRMLWKLTNIDAAIQRTWTLNLGRRQAEARLAHLFCESFVRLEVIERTQGNSLDFPLTQAQIGDCLGMTAIHVNRVLQSLRGRGLIELERKRLTILDHPGLAALAEFDPTYLYLRKPQR